MRVYIDTDTDEVSAGNGDQVIFMSESKEDQERHRIRIIFILPCLSRQTNDESTSLPSPQFHIRIFTLKE